MVWSREGATCMDQHSCDRSAWLEFLKGVRLAPLAAPTGGRAYRWLWVNAVPDPRGVLLAVPRIGFVEVVIDKDGTGTLRSAGSGQAFRIEAKEVAPFEAALAKTEFATLPDEDPESEWVDYPPEQLMESVIDGRYHFVHRVGGISEPGIRDAGVLLEELARRVRARLDE
jgi:hypothetical protein